MRPKPKFKAGNRVKIVRNGELYTTYTSFFDENDLSKFKSNYAFGVGMLIVKNDCIAHVVAHGYTKGCEPDTLYVIRLDSDSARDCGLDSEALYIIGEKGLELMPLQMTKAEAEAMYNIEIID